MKILRKLGSNLPLQLVLMILVVFLAGDYIPLSLKEFCYTISVLIKDLLVLALPYIIFAYLFSTLLALQNGAILFVVTLVAGVVFMNFLGLNIAYFMSGIITQASGLQAVSLDMSREVALMWQLPVPGMIKSILRNEYGLALGVISGVGLGALHIDGLPQISDRLKAGASFILNKMFIPVVPLFILGFLMKMEHEGTLQCVLKQYGPVYLMILGVQLTYTLFLFGIGSGFNPKTWGGYLRNMLPPAITGISTMSSAAALPFSLKAAEQNTQNPLIARSVIPATVNMNLMGDSIGVPLKIIATMVTFGLGMPEYSIFLKFAGLYVMYMFTVAAIPGATIIVMAPFIQQVFGFNNEMLGLVTALYILYDAFGTTMNVMGNGAFAVLYNRVFGRMLSNPQTSV